MYYIGSLAPDAIHAFSNAPRQRKVASHLLDGDTQMHESDNVETINNVKKFLNDKLLNSTNRAFYVGYAIHILTDVYWAENVFRKFLKNERISQLESNESDKLYYIDLERLQFEIYKNAKWVPAVFDYLRQAKVTENLPFLDSAEINRWKERTLQWFCNDESKYVEKSVYIPMNEIEEFVDNAAMNVYRELKDVCTKL